MNRKITRKDLIARAASKSGMTKTDVDKALDALTDSIGEILAEGDLVQLIGFGTFKPHLRKGKTGEMPATGKTYSTQDKKIPKFTPGKAFEEKLNR